MAENSAGKRRRVRAVLNRCLWCEYGAEDAADLTAHVKTCHTGARSDENCGRSLIALKAFRVRGLVIGIAKKEQGGE